MKSFHQNLCLVVNNAQIADISQHKQEYDWCQWEIKWLGPNAQSIVGWNILLYSQNGKVW